MNLEELKDIWQSQVSTAPTHSPEALSGMIRKRSQTALARINRNIKLEALIMLVVGMVSAWQWAQGNTFLQEMWIGFTVFSALSLVFYARKYQRLNQVDTTRLSLKESLEHTARTMKGYMRLYFYATLFLIPVLSIGGIFYGFAEAAAEEQKTLADTPLAGWLILGAISLIYVGLSYLFARWYVHRLYGVHYQELQDCLQELNEQEESSPLY